MEYIMLSQNFFEHLTPATFLKKFQNRNRVIQALWGLKLFWGPL
jgi:hypothetical protein